MNTQRQPRGTYASRQERDRDHRERTAKVVAEAREAALAAGLCVDCKAFPRAMNLDMRLGKRCEFCKVKSAKRPYQTQGRSPHSRPVSNDAWGIQETDFLDSPAYLEYCDLVLEAVRSVEDGIIANVKRAMGDRLNDNMLADALSTLTILKKIRQTREVSPVRFECV